MKYSLDFLRGMHGAPAEAADEIERLQKSEALLQADKAELQAEVERLQAQVKHTTTDYDDARSRVFDAEAGLTKWHDAWLKSEAEVEQLRANQCDCPEGPRAALAEEKE